MKERVKNIMDKKKKSRIAMALAATMLLAATGCSYQKPSGDAAKPEPTVTVTEDAIEEVNEETTETMTEETAEVATEEAAEDATEAIAVEPVEEVLGEDNNIDESAYETIDDGKYADREGYIDSGFDNAKANGFPQFDTELYRIEDVALEYRENKNIKNYKDFEYDLDGDGKKDVITLKKYGENEYGSAVHKLLLNGVEFFDFGYETLDGKVYTDFDDAVVYIVDLNKDDDSLEVMLYGWLYGETPIYRIFAKQGSEMVELEGNFGGYTDQKGIITRGGTGTLQVQLHIYDFYYKLEDNTVTECACDLSEIKDVLFTGADCLFTTDLSSIDKALNNGLYYMKAGFIHLTPDQKFTVLEFEGDLDIKVKLQDGTVGYIVGNHWCG